MATEMTKLASVIIPTYNRSDLILRALDSVSNQSYRPVEVLVIDDGSTDDTQDLVNEWKCQNSTESFRVCYLYKENGGPSSCRNVGLGLAEGEFIYFLDSDDYIHRGLLEDAINTINADGSDCVIFGFDFAGACGTYLPPSGLVALDAFLLGRLWGYTSTILRRSKLAADVGLWNESVRISEDYEYLGRTLFASKKTSVLQKRLLTVSRGGESLGAAKDSVNGLRDRLITEKTIVNLISLRRDISARLRTRYSSRLFKTAINKSAKNQTDFARELGMLAMEIDSGPWNFQDICKRFVWRQGRWLCLAWYGAARLYSTMNKYVVSFK